MGVQDMPAAEVDVGDDLVHGLLADQHPDLADRPLHARSEGWDNVMVRLGDDLVVRLPRRAAAADLVRHEQTVLPVLSSGLPIAVPVPLRVGNPGRGYPWAWSVLRWVDGGPAAHAELTDPAAEARRLGAFLAALHRPAPPDAPPNPYRGGPLVDRDDATRGRFDQLAGLVDRARVEPHWEAGLAAPRWGGAPVWLHGDLHPANVVVDRGRIVAVVDWGDVTAGDPATDLSVAWMLGDAGFRAELRTAVHADDATWTRARAWAVSLALAYLAHSADNPTMARVGHRTLAAVSAEPPR